MFLDFFPLDSTFALYTYWTYIFCIISISIVGGVIMIKFVGMLRDFSTRPPLSSVYPLSILVSLEQRKIQLHKLALIIVAFCDLNLSLNLSTHTNIKLFCFCAHILLVIKGYFGKSSLIHLRILRERLI